MALALPPAPWGPSNPLGRVAVDANLAPSPREAGPPLWVIFVADANLGPGATLAWEVLGGALAHSRCTTSCLSQVMLLLFPLWFRVSRLNSDSKQIIFQCVCHAVAGRHFFYGSALYDQNLT